VIRLQALTLELINTINTVPNLNGDKSLIGMLSTRLRENQALIIAKVLVSVGVAGDEGTGRLHRRGDHRAPPRTPFRRRPDIAGDLIAAGPSASPRPLPTSG
jgi:hypothetical protein